MMEIHGFPIPEVIEVQSSADPKARELVSDIHQPITHLHGSVVVFYPFKMKSPFIGRLSIHEFNGVTGAIVRRYKSWHLFRYRRDLWWWVMRYRLRRLFGMNLRRPSGAPPPPRHFNCRTTVVEEGSK
jgi:hypothetical protein